MDWLEMLELGDAERIAVQYTPTQFRARLGTFFALDRRLGQLVAQTTEPMLGQMRLAWWRDVLQQHPADRPVGDAVLDAIGTHWNGSDAALIALVDGWEYMLADPPLSEGDAREFIDGRIAALAGLFGGADNAALAAKRWACADVAGHTAQDDERALFVRIGLEDTAPAARFSRALRGFAVLHALSLRALKRGGRPLMEGRAAALIALRAGIIGI